MGGTVQARCGGGGGCATLPRMTDPPSGAGTSGRHAPLGIVFTLAGVDELTFTRILRDLMHDPPI